MSWEWELDSGQRKQGRDLKMPSARARPTFFPGRRIQAVSGSYQGTAYRNEEGPAGEREVEGSKRCY